jgi:hypothetical protein
MASASVLVATSLPLGGSWQLAKEGGPGSAAGPQLVQAGELVVRETHHHAVCSTRGHDCASRLRWLLEEARCLTSRSFSQWPVAVCF